MKTNNSGEDKLIGGAKDAYAKQMWECYFLKYHMLVADSVVLKVIPLIVVNDAWVVVHTQS